MNIKIKILKTCALLRGKFEGKKKSFQKHF
jgi:hypothetical protein